MGIYPFSAKWAHILRECDFWQAYLSTLRRQTNKSRRLLCLGRQLNLLHLTHAPLDIVNQVLKAALQCKRLYKLQAATKHTAFLDQLAEEYATKDDTDTERALRQLQQRWWENHDHGIW